MIQGFVLKDRNSSLCQIGKKHYALNYLDRRIGIIKPGIDCWYSLAEPQYGAKNNRLNNPTEAVDSLVENYLKIAQAGIKFEVSVNFCHYTIALDYWLIKIDVREEDCLATIQDGNDLIFEYFPTLNDAISFSFDLILNSPRSTNYSCDEEF